MNNDNDSKDLDDSSLSIPIESSKRNHLKKRKLSKKDKPVFDSAIKRRIEKEENYILCSNKFTITPFNYWEAWRVGHRSGFPMVCVKSIADEWGNNRKRYTQNKRSRDPYKDVYYEVEALVFNEDKKDIHKLLSNYTAVQLSNIIAILPKSHNVKETGTIIKNISWIKGAINEYKETNRDYSKNLERFKLKMKRTMKKKKLKRNTTNTTSSNNNKGCHIDLT